MTVLIFILVYTNNLFIGLMFMWLSILIPSVINKSTQQYEKTKNLSIVENLYNLTENIDENLHFDIDVKRHGFDKK